jgi:hypothetical protein
MNIKFEDLVGKSGILCAVDGFTFRIGDLTFEAMEDENDGYRSSLKEFRLVQNIRPMFREKVTIKMSDNHFYLINELEKTVLTIGTDYADDYYPVFVFNWEPRNLSTFVDYDSLLNTVTE